MKRTHWIYALTLAALMATQATTLAQEAPRKVALFVANRAEAKLDAQVPALEELITSQISGAGFSVVNRSVVLDAVDSLFAGSDPNKLDETLSDATSALRLAQNLGTDYILVASLLGMETETRQVKAYGVDLQNQIHTLRATWKLLNGNTGASLAGGTVSPSRTVQQTEHSQSSLPGLMAGLLDKASNEIAASLIHKASRGAIETVTLASETVNFSVAITLDGISLPEVSVDASGKPSLSDRQLPVEPLAVAVEVDGIVIGTTGQGGRGTTFAVSPGLHRLRLVRDDLIPFERMVNIRDSLVLNVTMELNERGRARWLEETRLINDLKMEGEINAAVAEEIRGMAQMLRQSGYKVDIKVDTDEAITVENNQSLMQQN